MDQQELIAEIRSPRHSRRGFNAKGMSAQRRASHHVFAMETSERNPDPTGATLVSLGKLDEALSGFETEVAA